MLHVTNGDAAANLLRRAGVKGEVLPWREMWIDGPARDHWYTNEALSERADFMEREYGIPSAEFVQASRSQLEVLTAAAAAGKDIILWFEYDLFDQAMLASLLHLLASWQSAGRTIGRVQWIIAESFPGIADFRGLGQLTPDQLLSLWPVRQEVTAQQVESGSAAWKAFVLADPREVTNWIMAGCGQMPVMAEAFRFHLRRFPSVDGGLGIVERATLSLLTEDGAQPDELFKEISRLMPLYGMGDLTYWAYLRRMKAGGLLTIEGSEPLPGYKYTAAPSFNKWRIRPTILGMEVLERKRDAVLDTGYWNCRWLGGVQIGPGNAVWRIAEAEQSGKPGMVFI